MPKVLGPCPKDLVPGPTALTKASFLGAISLKQQLELPGHPPQGLAQLLSQAICELGLSTEQVPVGTALWHPGTRLQQSKFGPRSAGSCSDLGELLLCVCPTLFLSETSLYTVRFGAHLPSPLQPVNTGMHRATFHLLGLSAGPVF